MADVINESQPKVLATEFMLNSGGCLDFAAAKTQTVGIHISPHPQKTEKLVMKLQLMMKAHMDKHAGTSKRKGE